MSINDIKNLKILDKFKKSYINCLNENSNFYCNICRDDMHKLIDVKNKNLNTLSTSTIFITNDEKKHIKNLLQQDILINLQILELLNDEQIIF